MITKEDCPKKNDEDLVVLVLEKKEYYLCLMARYEEKLMRYVRRISGLGEKDSEDILQNVFIKAYKNLNEFDQSLKFSSWIYRITHNEVVNHWRKISARPKTILLDDNDYFLNNLASDFNTEKDINEKETKENIQRVLSNLEEKYKEVLVLKYLEQKDYKEISDILKKPMGSVATLLNRAREKFKKEAEKKDIKF